MPLPHTLIDEGALSPGVRRAVGAGAPQAVRMSVARGLAPLPPLELATALYQLSTLATPEEQELREAARKTAAELPDSLLAVALAAPLDRRVLDFLARQVASRVRPLEPLFNNQAVADETFALLASIGGDQVLERIALNEERMLRHPAIITSLYLNRRTRPSTAMRAVELAIRAGVEVEGIPGFHELKAAIENEGPPPVEADAIFVDVLEGDAGTSLASDELTADEQAALALAEEADRRAEQQGDRLSNISNLPMSHKLRLAAIGGAFARARLIRDSNKIVALAAVRSPALTEQEAEKFAGNRSLHEEVVRYLASQRGFTKRYSVKLNLVNNPKCPLQAGMGFLSHLTAKDLRMVARSKSVPSALVKAAQGLLAKRDPS